MALIFMDGFDHMLESGGYGAGHKWDTWFGDDFIVTDGRFGSNGLAIGSNDRIVKYFGSTLTTVINNVWVKSSTGSGYGWFGITYNSGTGAQISITVDADGTIRARSGAYTGTILGSSSAGAFIFTGCYLEIKVVFHDTAGTVEVKVDGDSALSITGQDTLPVASSSGIDGVQINGYPIMYFVVDDFVICDNSGSYNNDWLGDVAITTLFPDAAGNYTQFTPSAGDNYECVNEAHPDDADKVTGDAAAEKDTYSFDGMPSPASVTIKAMQSHVFCKKTSGGTRKMRHVTRIGSTDYNGSDIPLTDNYAYKTQIQEVNPATSSAWTDAVINAAEFGFEVRGA